MAFGKNVVCKLTSMVLNEWHLHPPLGREVIVGVIKHTLSTNGQILPAGQVELPLIVPHPLLVPSLEEIRIRLIYEDIREFQFLVELHLSEVLLEYGVVVARVVCVGFGVAGLAAIGTVRLQH